MNVEYLFPTPVWHDDLQFDVNSLIVFAEQHRTDQKMDGGSYEPIYFDAANYRENNDAISDMIHQVEDKARYCYDDLDPFMSQCEMDNFWFLFTPPGDRIAVHTHPGAVLSGATYLQVPDGDCGSLSLRRNILESHCYLSMGSYSTGSRGQNPITFGSYSYPPLVNKIILFPGWTPHEVSVNRTDEERISLSFNIIVKRDFDPHPTRAL